MAADGTKELLKRYEPTARQVLKPDRPMCTVRFGPCGTLLAAAGTDATVRRWDLTADPPAELPALKGHAGWVQAIAFHPDGTRLFSADSWGKVCCWPVGEADPGPEPAPCWTIDAAHDGWIRDLAVSPDGTLVATCGSDRRVGVWSAADGTRQQECAGHGDDVFALAFHPDGKSLVSGDLKGLVKHWDLATGKPARDLDARVFFKLDRLQDVGGLRRLRFDAAGKTLACAGSMPKNGSSFQGTPTILLFDWDSGQVAHTLKVGNDVDGFVHDVAWHADGFLMAVTSGNPGTGKFFFMRPEDKAPFFLHTKLANCHALDIHPDGRRLVVSATNANSNGNGRKIGKGTEYPGNWSPIHFWELPERG
jgi:WD40 repeat protein